MLTDNKRFQNIDRKAVQVINTVTHSDLKVEENEDGENMCIALDQIQAEFKEEGRMEGRKEGIIEGKAAERIALAVRMLKTGEYSLSQITSITLLSEEEIQALSQKNNI